MDEISKVLDEVFDGDIQEHDGTEKTGNDDSQSKDTDCKHGRGYQKSQTGYLQSGVRRVLDERNRNYSGGTGRVRNHGRGGKF